MEHRDPHGERRRRHGDADALRGDGQARRDPEARVRARQHGREGHVLPVDQPQPEPRGPHRHRPEHGQRRQHAAPARRRGLEHGPGAARPREPDRRGMERGAAGVGLPRDVPPARRREGAPPVRQGAELGGAAAADGADVGRADADPARRLLPRQVRPRGERPRGDVR